MKILVAPNSYKECASSVGISKIICEELGKYPGLEIFNKPLSDGGDGFIRVCELLYEVKTLTYLIQNSYQDNLSNYKLLYSKIRRSIYIESAELFGLKVIPESERSPLFLTSEVLGKILGMISRDIKLNRLVVDEVWIGVGGIATIDFGIGACSQLGIKFLDKTRKKLNPVPNNFGQINKIENFPVKLPFKLKCVVDVNSELIGTPGAIEIYGKQKGASETDLVLIKKGIQNILNIISNNNNTLPKKINGAGGGLAAGLNIFFGAELITAEEFIKTKILQELNFNEIDAVITGEGRFDFQSFEGKGSGVILKMFRDKNIPIFLLNGSTEITPEIQIPENVFVINLIDQFESKEESIKNYEAGLINASGIVIKHLLK